MLSSNALFSYTLIVVIYPSFMVDKVTHIYNLDCQDIAYYKVTICPKIDFISSKPPAMYASIYPSRIGWKY